MWGDWTSNKNRSNLRYRHLKQNEDNCKSPLIIVLFTR